MESCTIRANRQCHRDFIIDAVFVAVLGHNDETRDTVLAGISQMYSAATPMYLFSRLANLFESRPNYTGQTTMVAMQVVAVILMIVIFTVGYFWGKTLAENGRLQHPQRGEAMRL